MKQITTIACRASLVESLYVILDIPTNIGMHGSIYRSFIGHDRCDIGLFQSQIRATAHPTRD